MIGTIRIWEQQTIARISVDCDSGNFEAFCRHLSSVVSEMSELLQRSFSLLAVLSLSQSEASKADLLKTSN